MAISIRNNLISKKDIELAFPSDTEALSPADAFLALKRAESQNDARKRINEDILSVCSDCFDPCKAEDVSQDIELALCVAVKNSKKITRRYVCDIIKNRINDAWRKQFREDKVYTGIERKDHHALRCEPRRVSYDEIGDGMFSDELKNTSGPVSYQRLGGTPVSLRMNPEEVVLAKEVAQLLNDAMESAEGKDRAMVTTVWLRVVEGLKHADIARIFGKSERNIKRWYREGCEYLRDWLMKTYGIDREWPFA